MFTPAAALSFPHVCVLYNGERGIGKVANHTVATTNGYCCMECNVGSNTASYGIHSSLSCGINTAGSRSMPSLRGCQVGIDRFHQLLLLPACMRTNMHPSSVSVSTSA